jgi:hypothetical protein
MRESILILRLNEQIADENRINQFLDMFRAKTNLNEGTSGFDVYEEEN